MLNQDFHDLLGEVLTGPDMGKEVLIRPGFSINVNKDALTPENKARFISAVQDLPGISQKCFWGDMVGAPPLDLEELQVLIMFGVGYALGVWKLYPIQDGPTAYNCAYKSDRDNMLPMISGLGKGDDDANRKPHKLEGPRHRVRRSTGYSKID